MRIQALLLILFLVTVPAWSQENGEAQAGNTPTTGVSEPPEGPKDPEDDTTVRGGGDVAVCSFPEYDDEGEAIEPVFGYTTCVAEALGTASTLPAGPTVWRPDTTPDGLCYKEDNGGVQYTYLSLPANDLVARIAKFPSGHSDPDGGGIEITIDDDDSSTNPVTVSFDTDGENVTSLNQLLYSALVSAGLTVTDYGDYLEVTFPRSTVTRISWWSQDDGLIFSEISLEAPRLDNSSYCWDESI